MSLHNPFALACVFVLSVPLSLYAQSVQAQSQQNQSSNPKPTSNGFQADIITGPRPQPQAARKQANPPLPTRSFLVVPRENEAYATVNELQTSGILKGYPENYFSGRRPLTYYEFAIALERITKSMHGLTLTRNGKKLQPVFIIPEELTQQQAQKFLTLWTEFKPELTGTGVSSAEINLTNKTLDTYINAYVPSQEKGKY